MPRRPPLILTLGFHGADGLACLSRELAGALVDHEPDLGVEVWSLSDRAAFVDEGFAARPGDAKIRVRVARGSRIRFASWALGEVLASQRERLVVVVHANLAPLALGFTARGARYIHVLVGIEVWKRLSPLQTRALESASCLVSISEHSARKFRAANPAFADRDAVICHPGLPQSDSDRCAAMHVGEAERPFALIVGRMSLEECYKGHDLLLEIWNDVTKRQPDAELVVVGGGNDRNRLENKARALKLSGSVRFAGKVDDSTLEKLYRDCAFFIMPSRGEGFGLVFLEAMRAGKLCVGGEGAASEIIENGVTGFVVAPDARERLGDLVVELFSKPEKRRAMGAEARRRFEAQFTTARFRERFLAALSRASRQELARTVKPRARSLEEDS